MNGARVFEDAYSGAFREQEDFFSCLHEIMGKSLWIRQKVRNLRLVPIIAGNTFEKELRSQYTEDRTSVCAAAGPHILLHVFRHHIKDTAVEQ